VPSNKETGQSKELKKWVVIVEVHYFYEGNTTDERIAHFIPIEMLSRGRPSEIQLNEAIIERLYIGEHIYTAPDIRDVIVLSRHSPEDVTMMGIGTISYRKLKTGKYQQRHGHCVVDWLYFYLGGRNLESIFEKRFYNFVGQECKIFGVTTTQCLDYIRKYHKNVSAIILDGTGGIIGKVIASQRENHIWIGGVSSNGHLSPIDDFSLVKTMVGGTFNEGNICDLLGICRIDFDYRNAIYLDSSKEERADIAEGLLDCPIDFTLGNKKTPIITNIPISILIKSFQLSYPSVMISSVSIERSTFVNPLTGGIISSMPDYPERMEALSLIQADLGEDIFKEFSESEVRTFSSMANTLFAYSFGELEKSYINPLIFDCKLRLAPKAINTCWMLKETVDQYNFQGCIDGNDHYFNAIQDNFLEKCYQFMMDVKILKTTLEVIFV
jgi:hypothetical protein